MTAPKRALITGATRGIGLACAHRLAGDGYDLDICYRSNDAAAAEAKQALEAKGATVRMYKTDLATTEGVADLVTQMTAVSDELSVLVNNAGGTKDGAFQMMSADDYMPVIRGNLLGPMALTLGLVPLLRRAAAVRGNASVVFLSSMAGVTGKEGQVPYATTKGGIIGLTRLLASRLGKDGITVNAVAPGFIRTEMVFDLPPETYEHVLKASASPRMGETEEVADLVAFLGSDASRYVNAQTLRIDGGFLR